MISEAERNYQPKKWRQYPTGPLLNARPLYPMELWRFCNTDSQAFRDLLALGKGDRAILVDYELISLGFDPTCGSMFHRAGVDGPLLLTVFTDEGPRYYIQT